MNASNFLIPASVPANACVYVNACAGAPDYVFVTVTGHTNFSISYAAAPANAFANVDALVVAPALVGAIAPAVAFANDFAAAVVHVTAQSVVNAKGETI